MNDAALALSRRHRRVLVDQGAAVRGCFGIISCGGDDPARWRKIAEGSNR